MNEAARVKLGWGLTGLATLILVGSAGMKLVMPPPYLELWTHFGFPTSRAAVIAVVELACAILYAVPRTSVLGVVLVTAYFGGATATLARVGDPTIPMPVAVAVLAWVGLWLRDPRLRALLPVTR